MTWSQMFVVGWLQFALASSLIFWLARGALRRTPQPVDRIRLTQCTLAATAILPLLIALTPWPAWRLEIVSPAQEVAAIPAQNDLSRQESAESRLDSAQVRRVTMTEEQGLPLQQVTETTVAAPLVVATPSSAPANKTVAIWSQFILGNTWMNVAVLILAVHGAALIWFVVLRCVGSIQLQRLCDTATSADEALVQTWNRITQQQGKHVRLCVSPSLDVPLMSGWWRPVVLIPQKLVNTGGSALSYCLAHEWSHIERHDFLAWKWVDACQILFWLQPGYWALRKELRLCQDLLADHRSTGVVGNAVEYSALLVNFARQRMTIPVAGALTFMDQPSQLTRRVKLLLEQTFLVRTRCTWRFSLTAISAVGLLVLLISGIRVEATRAADTKQDAPAAKAEDTAKPEKPAEPVKEPPVALKYFCSVVDKETGKGIPNAHVVIRRSILTSVENRIIEESKHVTDAEGKYVVDIPPEQVAEGALYIQIDAEHENYTSKMGHGYALGMIRKNEKMGERPFFEKTELVPADPVTGTVLSPDGKPLEGVKIQGFSMIANDFNSSSFYDTTTDANGKFRLNSPKEGDAVMWVIPKDFAPVEKFLAKQRDDQGEFRLTAGIRVSGRLVGIDQKPVAGVPVNIDYNGDREVNLPVATSVRRGVITDADGRFEFDPLPTGQYRLTVDENLQDPLLKDRTRYSIPAVFLAKKVQLKADSEPAFQEIQAVPYVVIHAQNLNSKGEKSRGHAFHLFGRLDGESWFGSGRPNNEGTIEMRVPHGLQNVQINLMNNEHGATRYRLGSGKPLRDDVHAIRLETLNDDIEGFEVIRYKAPIVLVSAFDTEKQSIKKLQIKAKYATPRPDAYISFANGSDINMERQNDGKYRTSQMLPDEDTTFTISAEGYASIDEKVNLKEGESKELAVTLKKADGSDDNKPSPATPKPDEQNLAKAGESSKFNCSIVDHDTGKGISKAIVKIRQLITSPQGEKTVRESKHITDDAGHYQLDVANGELSDPTLRFQFDIEHDNYAAVLREFSFLAFAGKKDRIQSKIEKISLFAGQPVTGVLVSPDGQPQPNIPLQVYWSTVPPRRAWGTSFHFTKTDQQGKFRIVIPNSADAVLWVLPHEFAVIEKLIPKERGDLGEIRLSAGIRVGGQVLGIDGKPLPKTIVNIEYIGERNIGDVSVATSISRGAFTDADGRFAFDPLPPGNYRIEPADYLAEFAKQDFSRHPVPGVFRAQRITLKDGVDPEPQRVQALPHVVFRAKFLDGAGKPTTGHQLAIKGKLDGEFWRSNTIPVPIGEVSMYVPHGLSSAELSLINNDLRSERYRNGKGKQLVSMPGEFGNVELGTLNDDVDGFEIIRYQAPSVVISAVDQDKKPISAVRAQGKYPWGQQRMTVQGGLKSDVSFESDEKDHLRSVRLLPDEEVTITIGADGYESVDEKVNLKEGETKALVVSLKKVRATASTDSSK